MPKYRRAERFNVETPQPVQVTEVRESGGKRKGKRMKRKPSELRTGYVTRKQLENAPQNAEVLLDSRGRVRMLVYTRR